MGLELRDRLALSNGAAWRPSIAGLGLPRTVPPSRCARSPRRYTPRWHLAQNSTSCCSWFAELDVSSPHLLRPCKPELQWLGSLSFSLASLDSRSCAATQARDDLLWGCKIDWLRVWLDDGSFLLLDARDMRPLCSFPGGTPPALLAGARFESSIERRRLCLLLVRRVLRARLLASPSVRLSLGSLCCRLHFASVSLSCTLPLNVS